MPIVDDTMGEIKGEAKMDYTIEIIRVKNGDADFVVGCHFAGRLKANQVFHEIENRYSVEPNYTNEFLVDFYENGDLVSTFVTNEANAYLIDEIYFK